MSFVEKLRSWLFPKKRIVLVSIGLTQSGKTTLITLGDDITLTPGEVAGPIPAPTQGEHYRSDYPVAASAGYTLDLVDLEGIPKTPGRIVQCPRTKTACKGGHVFLRVLISPEAIDFLSRSGEVIFCGYKQLLEEILEPGYEKAYVQFVYTKADLYSAKYEDLTQKEFITAENFPQWRTYLQDQVGEPPVQWAPAASVVKKTQALWFFAASHIRGKGTVNGCFTAIPPRGVGPTAQKVCVKAAITARDRFYGESRAPRKMGYVLAAVVMATFAMAVWDFCIPRTNTTTVERLTANAGCIQSDSNGFASVWGEVQTLPVPKERQLLQQLLLAQMLNANQLTDENLKALRNPSAAQEKDSKDAAPLAAGGNPSTPHKESAGLMDKFSAKVGFGNSSAPRALSENDEIPIDSIFALFRVVTPPSAPVAPATATPAAGATVEPTPAVYVNTLWSKVDALVSSNGYSVLNEEFKTLLQRSVFAKIRRLEVTAVYAALMGKFWEEIPRLKEEQEQQCEIFRFINPLGITNPEWANKVCRELTIEDPLPSDKQKSGLYYLGSQEKKIVLTRNQTKNQGTLNVASPTNGQIETISCVESATSEASTKLSLSLYPAYTIVPVRKPGHPGTLMGDISLSGLVWLSVKANSVTESQSKSEDSLKWCLHETESFDEVVELARQLAVVAAVPQSQ